MTPHPVPVIRLAAAIGAISTLVSLASLLPLAALAQAYPVKPIQILSGASVGSAGDTGMRAVTQRMSETIGQPIVVEARRGAGGLEAYGAVAKAAPTGYTLMFANAGIVTNQYLRKGWPIDVQKDRKSTRLNSSH